MDILIIKLGALGDVLRTTPLLTGLLKKYPKANITWIVDKDHKAILQSNPQIHRCLAPGELSPKEIGKLHFDLAINLDKEEEALSLMSTLNAVQTRGFGMDRMGRLCPVDALSDYAYQLGVDDHLKFSENRKSYQQICFEQVGLKFDGEEYLLDLDKETIQASRKHLYVLGVPIDARSGPVIGLNTGSGKRFAGKKLPPETYLQLIERFVRELNATVLLLGGDDEIKRNREIERCCSVPVVNTGSYPILFFAGMVRLCDLVISGDTTAMHIAIAMKVPVVAYFASTCAVEIELYGRGKKIVSSIDCSPCYKKICPIDEQCMKDMTADEIFQAAKEVLKR